MTAHEGSKTALSKTPRTKLTLIAINKLKAFRILIISSFCQTQQQKMPPIWPQGDPRKPQEGSYTAQRAAKIAQKRPNRTPSRLKKALRQLTGISRKPPHGPQSLQTQTPTPPIQPTSAIRQPKESSNGLKYLITASRAPTNVATQPVGLARWRDLPQAAG